MKTVWLFLAALFAFVAVGTGQVPQQWPEESISIALEPIPKAQTDPPRRPPPRRKPCLGCYTAMSHETTIPVRKARTLESVSPAMGETTRRRFCPSCYTAILQRPPEQPDRFQVEGSISIALEPIPEEPQKQLLYNPDTFQVEESIPVAPKRILQDLRPGARKKRAARGAALARRGGKQRSGNRAVCRGCYSGLMIMAPPAQESQNETLIGSHSESEGDSSEENQLPPIV